MGIERIFGWECASRGRWRGKEKSLKLLSAWQRYLHLLSAFGIFVDKALSGLKAGKTMTWRQKNAKCIWKLNHYPTFFNWEGVILGLWQWYNPLFISYTFSGSTWNSSKGNKCHFHFIFSKSNYALSFDQNLSQKESTVVVFQTHSSKLVLIKSQP